jgi:probable O-glycosylation ligase (exosortase A-associated)
VKQTAFMILLTFIGTFGAFVNPFYGVAVYYVFAVMRPQYIWVWALPSGMRWSLYVAVATVFAALLNAGTTTHVEAASEARGRTFSLVHLAMLLFSLWVVLTYITAQNREAAWPWFVVYLKIFLMFFVSSVLVRTLRQVWILLILTALSVGYIAYEVNFMYFASGYMGIYFNGYGGVDNNGAGLMFAMAIPPCIFIYMGTTRWWRWIFAALVPFLLHAVLMTFSRGAMVSLLVAAPVIFLRGKNRVQLLLAFVAIASIIPFLAGKEIRARFFTVENYEDEGSAQLRFASWEAAYHIALDYPVFGVGVRNSPLISAEYGADMQGRVIHSQLLQLLADNGFPGLFLYLLVVVSVFVSLRRVRRWARPRGDPDAVIAYAVACGVEGSIAVFFVGSLFLSLEVFELPYVMLLLGAQLPLVLEAQGLKTSERQIAPTPMSIPRPAPRPSAVSSPGPSRL